MDLNEKELEKQKQESIRKLVQSSKLEELEYRYGGFPANIFQVVIDEPKSRNGSLIYNTDIVNRGNWMLGGLQRGCTININNICRWPWNRLPRKET